MDADEQSSLDDSFRLITVGSAILDEAEDNPAFRRWLMRFLDARLHRQDDRDLFDLPEFSGAEVLPFPALPPKAG